MWYELRSDRRNGAGPVMTPYPLSHST